MAIKFNQAQGSAKKEKIDQYTYKEGDNKFRQQEIYCLDMFTGLKAKMLKIFLMECLAFDRDTETFNNKEKD